MIRVRVESKEEIPGSLLERLKQSEKIEILRQPGISDIRLIYIKTWNRLALPDVQLNYSSKPPVIVCERYEEPFTTESLMRQHVSGVLLENANIEQLVTGLYAAATGLRFLHPLKTRFHGTLEFEQLTQREIEILRLVADGEGNKSIASLLKISEHTVKFHLSSIFEKLNVSSRTEAIRVGISRGYISI
jgi:DNA-binding NarL/FixJ family response regulator